MWAQLFVVMSVTSLAMVTPGPDMMLVLRNTFLGGRRAGWSTSTGVLAGNLVHISYSLLGIGWVISRSILAFAGLKYAAAVYLVYLGVMSLRVANPPPENSGAETSDGARSWFLQGFVNNVLNPKGALFYFGVFTVVIAPGTSAATMGLLVGSMMLVSASFWLLFVRTLDRPAIRRRIAQSHRTVNRLFGGLMILLGLRVALADR